MPTTDPFAAVPGPLRNALQRRGFESLTAVQGAVLRADSEGRDLRISSQTGSGKTVALGLALARSFLAQPADEPTREVLALVITPTRELAVQVRDELRWLLAELPGMRVEAVTGGTDLRGDWRMLRRPPQVLVGTPGRLLDHIRGAALRCGAVEHVVLDEADRMLDMGFRDELEAIVEALPEQRRSHLVSATFSGPVRRIADRFQRDALHLQGTTLGEANEDIEHLAQLVVPHQRYAALVNALLLGMGERVLVFVDRRAEAAELADMLAADGFAALPFSGDLSQAQRTRTLHAFRSATIQVLVSTDVAARGIDVPDISMVVHMSPPSDSDGYTHRSGRTGRAGQRGKSLLLVPPRAQWHVRRLLETAGIEADWRSAPTVAKVRKAITKATRRRLHARLEADERPADKTLEYAARLLEGRDAATVVAALLEQAEPQLPREPMDVEAITPGAEPEPRAQRRPARDARRGWSRGSAPRRHGDQGNRRARPSSADRRNREA